MDKLTKRRNKEITRRRLFECIYDLHICQYASLKLEQRVEQIYFPVDVPKIAQALGASTGIVHQILYYYDSVYTKDKKHFFTCTNSPEGGKWSVNFPLLCLLLGELREKEAHDTSIRCSAMISASAAWAATIVAVVALIISFCK